MASADLTVSPARTAEAHQALGVRIHTMTVSGSLTTFFRISGSREKLSLIEAEAMSMTATMREKQRQAVTAMEAARSQGCSLMKYAQENGLDTQRIYSILTMLLTCRPNFGPAETL
jgi:hypothetical protein